MKVLYIIGGEGNRYGSEIIAMNLLAAGKEAGIEYIVIAANKGAVTDFCSQNEIDYHVVPFSFFVYKAMSNPLLDLLKKLIWRVRAEVLTFRAVSIIEKIVDMNSIDIIHTNLSRDLLGGIIAKRNHIPHIWHIQEMFESHYQLSFLRKNQIDWMTKHSDCFIAISETVASGWIKAGLPRNKIVVVYNGIDFSKITPKNLSSTQNDKILRLVMVGHIVPAKGQEQVVNMLSKLPTEIKNNIQFDCIGQGATNYLNHIKSIAQNNNVNLRMKGYRNDIGSLLHEYDIGINCSRGEGFGLSTVEYMAAGVCVVAADTGANIEIIKHKENGFIFDYNEEKSFVDLITYLYENRETLVEAAKVSMNEAYSNYSLATMQDSIYSLYGNILSSMQNKSNSGS